MTYNVFGGTLNLTQSINPLVDVICKRAVLFVNNCLSSSSDVVSMLLITMFISVAWLQYLDAVCSSVVNILQYLLIA